MSRKNCLTVGLFCIVISMALLSCMLTPPQRVPELMRLGVYADNRLSDDQVAEVIADIQAALSMVEIMFVERCDQGGGDVDVIWHKTKALTRNGADCLLILATPSVTTRLLSTVVPVKHGVQRGKTAVAYAEIASVEHAILGVSGIAIHEVKHLLGYTH